jgi:Domain of unknown function (DUF4340)
VTWRGTVLLLLAGIGAAALLLITLRTRTRPADAPLLGIFPGETTGIVITGAGFTTVMENREGVWWITQPILDRADPAKVSKLLEAAADVVPLDKLRPTDLKGSISLESLDLKPVKRSLVFQGKGNHTLRIGSEGATADRLYAQIDSDPSVYLISSELASQAFHPVDELRDLSPFPLRADHLSGISIQQQGGYRELSLRKKGREWNLDSPLIARADAHAVENWINSMYGSKILRWMPVDTEASACGLDTPEIILTLLEPGADPVRLELGKAIAGSPGARYARTPGRPGIFVLGNIEPWLTATPSSLRLSHPSPVELDAVDRILITRSGQTTTLSRKPQTDDWLCGDRIIPGSSVKGWCARLQEAIASSFETATPEHLAGRAIDPATSGTVSIRFVAHLSENSAEESAGEITLAEWTIGTPSADGTLALREGKSDDLMILSSATITPLLEQAKGWIVPIPPASPSPIAP